MPKYAIITDTTVIDISDNEYGALETAVKNHPEAKHLPFANEKDLMDSTYSSGSYIITDVRTAKLIEKVKDLQQGYFYNSEKYHLNILKVWTILEISDSTASSYLSGNKAELPICVETNNVLRPKTTIKTNVPCPGSTCTKLGNAPVQISTKIDKTSTSTVPQYSTPSSLLTCSLTELAEKPYVLSICTTNNQLSCSQYDKIEMLINHNIASNKIREDNLIIVTNNDKTSDSWIKRYPSCFVYGKPDNEFTGYLNAQKTSKTANSFIVFDNCMTKDYIEKPSFHVFMSGLSNNLSNIAGIVIMTSDSEVINASITHPILSKELNKVFIHTFTLDWMPNISSNFIKQFPILKDHKTLESYVIECIRQSTCLVIKKANNGTNTAVKMF